MSIKNSFFESLSPEQKNKFSEGVRFYVKEITNLGSRLPPKELMNSINLLVDEEIALTHTKHKASCSKGCSFCCYLHVDISSAEAEVLKEFVTDDMLPTLKVQEVHTLETWKTLSYYRRKCVFLKNGECSVYENRPIACRKYLTVSKPKHCNTEFKIKTVLNLSSMLPEMISLANFLVYGGKSMAKQLLDAKSSSTNRP